MTRHRPTDLGMHASKKHGSVFHRGHSRHCRRFPALVWLEGRILLSTLMVSNLDDHGSGSLRDAIERADLDPGSIIGFRISGTITLSSALPVLSQDVTIHGPGASELTVERSFAAGTPEFSVLAVGSGVRATISGLTIAGGKATLGGGIANSGTLTVSDCTLSGNSATNGGGIDNIGTLAISSSSLAGNSATNGGGFINFGTVAVSACTLSGNSATHGGGIFNSGRLQITNTILSENSAIKGVGVAAADAAADSAVAKLAIDFGKAIASTHVDIEHFADAITSVVEDLGSEDLYGGGGIANLDSGTLTISSSSLSGNRATNGGGIANSGTLNVNDCSFSGNTARIGGGGIVNMFGTLMIRDCTLSGNSATSAGGIGNIGTLTIDHSILTGNSASRPGGGGGAITNLQGEVMIDHSTLSGNSADTTDEYSSGGGIVNLFGTLTVANSTISGNVASRGAGIGNTGSLTVSDSTVSGNRSANGGDIIGQDTPDVSSIISTETRNVSLEFDSNASESNIKNVVPQALITSISNSFSAGASGSRTGTGAQLTSIGVHADGVGAPPAGTIEIPADSGDTSADTGMTSASLAALSSAILAITPAPGESESRLVPLRESALALVGTLLVLTLDTATNDADGASFAPWAMEDVLVAPGPTTAIRQGRPPQANFARTEGAIAAGMNSGFVANPTSQAPSLWENFILGVDDYVDQFRREHPYQPRDKAEPKMEGEEASSSDAPIDMRPSGDADQDRWKRGMSAAATDEAIDSLLSEVSASTQPSRSGSWQITNQIRLVPSSCDAVCTALTPSGPVRRGGDFLLQPPSPEEPTAGPLLFSLSWVALGSVANRTGPRRQQCHAPWQSERSASP